jgi:hypothetical protein
MLTCRITLVTLCVPALTILRLSPFGNRNGRVDPRPLRSGLPFASPAAVQGLSYPHCVTNSSLLPSNNKPTHILSEELSIHTYHGQRNNRLLRHLRRMAASRQISTLSELRSRGRQSLALMLDHSMGILKPKCEKPFPSEQVRENYQNLLGCYSLGTSLQDTPSSTPSPRNSSTSYANRTPTNPSSSSSARANPFKPSSTTTLRTRLSTPCWSVRMRDSRVRKISRS